MGRGEDSDDVGVGGGHSDEAPDAPVVVLLVVVVGGGGGGHNGEASDAPVVVLLVVVGGGGEQNDGCGGAPPRYRLIS